jgi:hypothetical protein
MLNGKDEAILAANFFELTVQTIAIPKTSIPGISKPTQAGDFLVFIP